MRKKNFLTYPKSAVTKARKLRRGMTDAEKKLWTFLRRNYLGTHFRRQVPFGPYILDFLAINARLAVELDGSQHYEPKGKTRDTKRDVFLKEQGLAVLRFTDREVLGNINGVMQRIIEHIQQDRFSLPLRGG